MAHVAQIAGLFDCRDAWVNTLVALGADDDRICAVVNDSVGSSKLGAFQKAYPDRLINVGIAEQVMVGVGAGLANGGQVPFVSAAGCFLTGRALEQLKADVAYSNFNVKLVGQSSGVAYAELGPTHHSIEDFAWLRVLKNIITVAPADPWEVEAAVRWAADHVGPVYIRLSRMPVPALDIPDREFIPGRAQLAREGHDVTIIACGTITHLAIAAHDVLAAQGIAARVLNMHTINPLDEAAIAAAATETGAIVTAEEAHLRGGLGGAVAEYTSAHRPVPVERLGFDGFQPTGDLAHLFERSGLTVPGIVAAAQRAVARK